MLLPLAPVAGLLLWGLDAWFLREERAYRRHYDTVRKLTDDEVDFAMDVSELRGSIVRVAFSATLAWFYLLLVGVSGVAALHVA